MSELDKDMVNETDPTYRMFTDAMVRMMIGAGAAALLFFGTLILLWFIYFIGTFLPEESKLADDPTPDSFPWLSEAEE